MQNKKYILSAEAANKKLRRMAFQVAEQNYNAKRRSFLLATSADKMYFLFCMIPRI